MYENQAGFRKNRSTADHIFTAAGIVQKYLCKPKGRMYGLYVDFSKAFDRVPHKMLFSQLMKIGLHGDMLKTIMDMYSKLESCVQSENSLTKTFKCKLGTRQGCMLSPLLFALYLNQYIEMCQLENCKGVFLNNIFYNLCLLLYADDILQCTDSVGRLQKQVDTLGKYCFTSGM